MTHRTQLWKRLAAAAILSAAVFVPGFYAAAAEDINEPEQLYARSAVLMDADSGRILFAKNGQEERAMASTTKIMTAILVMEHADLEEWAEVSAEAAAQPEVHLGVREGQQFQVKDVLYSLMLESHNDAAVILAEHVGGSVSGFAELMNQKAGEIGCADTYFITPNGLDAADAYGTHHTTAENLAKIMKYCIRDSSKKDLFLEITQTQTHTFTDREGNGSYSCQNHNAFLKMMDGALSGKTGFTNDAGYCYVALLACGWPNNKSYKWRDTRTLMEYGLESFAYVKLPPQMRLPALEVANGAPSARKPNANASVSLGCAQDFSEKQVLLRKDREIRQETEIQRQVSAPLKKGTVVGHLRYWCEGELLEEREIVTLQEVKERNLSWCMQWMLREMCLTESCLSK